MAVGAGEPGGLERGSRGRPLAGVILPTGIGKTCKHVADVAREIPPHSRPRPCQTARKSIGNSNALPHLWHIASRSSRTVAEIQLIFGHDADVESRTSCNKLPKSRRAGRNRARDATVSDQRSATPVDAPCAGASVEFVCQSHARRLARIIQTFSAAERRHFCSHRLQSLSESVPL